MKNKSFNIANMPKYGYINRALSKISKLALVGYQSLAHIPRLNAVFLCVLSTRSRFMVKLEGDAFARAGDLESQSTNPFQLCHLNYLVVIGKASIDSLGAHLSCLISIKLHANAFNLPTLHISQV